MVRVGDYDDGTSFDWPNLDVLLMRRLADGTSGEWPNLDGPLIRHRAFNPFPTANTNHSYDTREQFG